MDGVTREGWLGLEGPRLVEEAMQASATATIQSVLAGQSATAKFQSLIARLPAQTEIIAVSDRMFAQIAATETPQGIAALVEIKPPDFESILTRPGVLLLVACGIQDPGNLGTIIRSGQALGADALIALRETVSPFNPKTVRASAGAILRFPIFRNQEAAPLFERLRRAQVRLIAADRHSKTPLADADLKNSVAFLIGREASGLHPEVATAADITLSIPIRPETDSVNAAAAASIFLYEAARQRGFRY
ncbi:MAG TPA: RNA methyltransferase, partial [Terriglobia bacterium]|nr:RNA methyltransferase [Terriglobia bacterium]